MSAALTPFQRPSGFAGAARSRRRELEEPTVPLPAELPEKQRESEPSLVKPAPAGAASDDTAAGGPVAPGPAITAPDTSDRAAELSDMILFDYLIHNGDRWGGNFTNVRTRGHGGPLVYLDNAAGFSPVTVSSGLMNSRLHALQRFRRSTVEAIRTFDLPRFEARMLRDPLSPILTRRQLDSVDARRRALLAHVAQMEARYGAEAFPW